MRVFLLFLKHVPVVGVVMLFLVSCGQPREEVERLMAQAEAALEQQPDSAVHYLYAVKNPYDLWKDRRMHYFLLLLQAKDKAYKDISDDLVIVDAKNYFLRKKDFLQAALAAFYCGRVWSERNDDMQALQAYLEAAEIAANTTNSLLKGKIAHNAGYLYYNTGTEYQKAIDHFKTATGLFSAERHDAFTVASLKYLGTCFLLQNQADSALCYQQQALDIAMANRDTMMYADILNSLSVTYRIKNDNLQAKMYALQAAALDENRENLLNLALIYYNLNENDSAAFHAHRVKQLYKQDSLLPPAPLHELLANIAKQSRQFEQAVTHQEKYAQRILEISEEERERSIAGIREQYDMTQVQNENQRLQIQRSQWLITALSMLLIATLIVFFFLYWGQRQKKRLVQLQKDRNALFEQRIDSYKKARQLDQQLTILEQDKEKREKIGRKVHQIYYDANEGLTWDNLYALINDYYHSRFEQIRQLFPQLDELEFKIACLEYCRFKNDEMAVCLGRPQNTITTKKTSLHKKVGFTRGNDIKAHFDKLTG
jgi:tetratricopeptide (TPR) repeat protein